MSTLGLLIKAEIEGRLRQPYICQRGIRCECEGRAERKKGSIVVAESRTDLRTPDSYMPTSFLVV